MNSIFEAKAKNIKGEMIDFSSYQGKTLLIVNTASECGFTKQYKDLESLYQKFKDQEFLVLGFPCNQFGGQEPGDDGEILNFCEVNFGVTFPLFSKVDVNGKNSHEIFNWLKSQAKGILGTEAIKWNFTKFLVTPDGKNVTRYSPQTSPESIIKDIEDLLK